MPKFFFESIGTSNDKKPFFPGKFGVQFTQPPRKEIGPVPKNGAINGSHHIRDHAREDSAMSLHGAPHPYGLCFLPSPFFFRPHSLWTLDTSKGNGFCRLNCRCVRHSANTSLTAALCKPPLFKIKYKIWLIAVCLILFCSHTLEDDLMLVRESRASKSQNKIYCYYQWIPLLLESIRKFWLLSKK